MSQIYRGRPWNGSNETSRTGVRLMNKTSASQIARVLAMSALGFAELGCVSAGEHVGVDARNATYVIEGKRITLRDGAARTAGAPGSASTTVTRYFGNELRVDLNEDGREDVVFILTQETGGSGVFYYAVAGLNTEHGYVGSDGYLLGDRIAPQSIEVSQNPRHRNVLVVNYADRLPGEPMSTKPSVVNNVYIKLDLESMKWGIVEPAFEGESSL
jgi:hypothetical protein